MNIILGFGSVEAEQRKSVWRWVKSTIRTIVSDRKYNDLDNFDHNDYEKFCKSFKVYQKIIHEDYEINEMKTLDKPERYFHISYGCRIAWNLDTIFVKIGFWHINSRHPMSPDGIALLQVEESKHFTICDLLEELE